MKKIPFHIKLATLFIFSMFTSIGSITMNEYLADHNFFSSDVICKGTTQYLTTNYEGKQITSERPCEFGEQHLPQIHWGAKHIALVTWEWIICATLLIGTIITLINELYQFLEANKRK